MMKRNYILEKFKTREEWIKNRGIGGSSVAAVIDQNPWMTKLDLYRDLALGIKKEVPQNERMLEGTLAEEHIRALWALEHKDFVVTNPPKKVFWQFRRKDYPLMTYTPDGLLTRASDGVKGIIEIKDVELRSKEKRENWESGTLPQNYYCQALQAFIVKSDIEFLAFVARLKYYAYSEELNDWVFDHTVDRTYWIFRNDIEEEIKYLEQEEITFINVNIKGKKRPQIKVIL